MARDRVKIDTRKYSGRVAARIRKLIDEKQVPIKTILKAINKVEPVSERTLFAYLNNTRTLHPDLYPAVAKAIKVPIAELLPTK